MKIEYSKQQDLDALYEWAKRTFNCMPRKIRNLTGVKTDKFKKHLNICLQPVSGLPRCIGYVGSNGNAVYDQSYDEPERG